MAAWLYYVHNMGQEQVARALHLSRTKVTRLLSNARESGLVKITLDHELAETLALSDWIAARYGIERCILSPPTNVKLENSELSEQIGRQAVGMVAANILHRRVSNEGAITIGVGGGRTLGRVADNIRRLSETGVKVVSLTGTASTDDGSSAYSVALNMADILGGRAMTMPVPLYLGSPETQAHLAADPLVRDVLELGEKADLKLLGCGTVGPDSNFSRVTKISKDDLDHALQAGAVCEIGGLLLNEDGTLTDTPLNRCRMGVSDAALRTGDTVVIAAGIRKVRPLKAAIRAGYARTIIVDHEIATQLVVEASQKKGAALVIPPQNDGLQK